MLQDQNHNSYHKSHHTCSHPCHTRHYCTHKLNGMSIHPQMASDLSLPLKYTHLTLSTDWQYSVEMLIYTPPHRRDCRRHTKHLTPIATLLRI